MVDINHLYYIESVDRTLYLFITHLFNFFSLTTKPTYIPYCQCKVI